MATVRFSDELKNDICLMASKLFDAAEREARDNYPKEWGMKIYDTMFMDHKNAMLALPKDYFQRVDSINFKGLSGVAIVSHTIDLQLEQYVPMPYTTKAEDHGLAKEWGRYNGCVIDEGDPRWGWLVPEYTDYCAVIDTVMEERHVFLEGVTKVITTYSTLAPALKAWPPLWDLVPESAKVRHRTIVDRKKTEVVIEGVDLDSMTAVSALAKLSGGN
jgi:hypothetical protein